MCVRAVRVYTRTYAHARITPAGAWVQSTPQAHHLHAVGDLLVHVLVTRDVERDQEVDTRAASLEDRPLRLDGAEELAQQASPA